MTEDLATRVLATARVRGWHIATAESCTGGMVGAALTEIAGSSDVFDRGYVTYSNAAKTEMIGVPPELIARHGAVSEEVARAMAEGARAASGVELAIAITGVAGPGASEAKPEGLVWFAAATAAGTDAERHDFGPLGRARVRFESTRAALALALRALLAPV
ncbi:CinA family protein [uncultured Amaricoccus sp.]|uniref:CinA family protein n=1 Tax=uncultured Amaricoccus sp. TaxID=339341 RepID=UPI002617A012|nr:CinA family protein [uncultured Amaricoccus sp.]